MIPSRDGVSASCVVLPAGHWGSLYEFLVERFPAVADAEWAARFERGDIRDEHNNPLRSDTVYQVSQKIYYFRHIADEAEIPFSEKILFQDELILVADKPHFLPVVPSGRYVRETLLSRLKKKVGMETLTPMHRIDKDTAGLVLFTMQPNTRDAYQRMFREKRVSKLYHAIAPINDMLIFPMRYRNRIQESSVFMQMQVVEGVVNAETEIELLDKNKRYGLYALRPTTGQKHQLRVQMFSLGIPILNDCYYPELLPDEQGPSRYAKPLQLLAKSIAFIDPICGRERYFESEHTLQLPLD